MMAEYGSNLDGKANFGTGGGGAGVTSVHKNVVPLPNATFRYEGWAAATGAVTEIRVLMVTKHTVGSYTALFTNEATGNTMLVGATYSMAGVTAGLVETLTLTGVAGDLQFTSGDKWSVEFTSDNPGFDGDGIYFDILWGNDPAAFSVPAAPDDDFTLSMVVSPGNTVNELFFAPYALTLVGARAYCESGATSAGGLYTLAVEDIDLANNLLAAATFNMETPGAGGSLLPATLTTVPLTGTTANLDLAPGTRVRIRLVSDNADLVATGVRVQLLFRGQ
jgi:hypothetical protein